MRKTTKNIFISLLSVFMMLTPLVFRASVFADGESADDHCYHGAIIDVCDDGKGSGVIEILNIVVNIFTVVIGILAAVGIAITGTQYLTAGPNEEKTRKAKRRLIEIVIGVAAYVLIYSLLLWLLPGFKGFGS